MPQNEIFFFGFSFTRPLPMKLMMKLSANLQFLSLSLLALVVSFQNCSEVDLVAINQNSIKEIDPTPTSPPNPEIADGILDFDIGDSGGCALKNNKVYCWGSNATGLVGDTVASGYPAVSSATPLLINIPSDVVITRITVDVYGGHACAETTNSKIYCWGGNGSGELGDPNLPTGYSPEALSLTPVLVIPPIGISLSKISAGVSHSCALSADGLPYCWGRNGHGQLGLGTNTLQTSIPTQVPVPAGVSFVTLSSGYQHTCGLMTTGSIYCWGGINTYGEIGNSSAPVYRNIGDPQFFTPTLVSNPSGVVFTSVSAGGYSTCAMASSSVAYCWGQNGHSQLGNTNVPAGSAPDGWDHYSNIPVPYLAGQEPFIQVSAGAMLNCAVTQIGNVHCRGQYGPATANSSYNSSPVAGEKIIKAEAAANTACALTDSNALYCWGSNRLGALGSGSETPSFSNTPLPVQVP